MGGKMGGGKGNAERETVSVTVMLPAALVDQMKEFCRNCRVPRDIVVERALVEYVAVGLDRCFKEGIERAKVSIDSGQAKEKLQQLIAFTQQCRPFVRKEL